jgi:hypothetical protein
MISRTPGMKDKETNDAEVSVCLGGLWDITRCALTCIGRTVCTEGRPEAP